MVEENEYAGKKSHEILKAVLAKPVAEMEPGTGGSLDHPVEHPFSKWLDEFAKEAMEATTDASEERIIYGKVRALEGLPEAERVIKKLTAGHAADERDIVVLQ